MPDRWKRNAEQRLLKQLMKSLTRIGQKHMPLAARLLSLNKAARCTAVVTVAQDGSALKRDYGHCYTGSAAAVFAVDKETGLVVDKGISQASCHCCVRACNARLRERREAGNPITPSELKNMSKDEILALYDHDGFCYRNSSYSPGVAEEHLAENVGS